MVYTPPKKGTQPFPQLFDILPQEERWPPPPFGWDHETIDDFAIQPSRLQLRTGLAVDGEMVAFEAVAGRVQFRHPQSQKVVPIAFDLLRSVTLTRALVPMAHAGSVPTPEHECDFRLEFVDSSSMSGTTVGKVESAFGVFLFPPVDVDASVVRVFVPRSALRHVEFGRTTLEKAASRWIREPRELVDAIERQDKAPVLPMGQALLNLGLATPSQIERALAQQTPERSKPLGQTLVDAGIVSPIDLEAALAHKMGYPLVDVEQFPIDPAATRQLTLRTVQAIQALPLMVDDKRLVLAVASPSRVSSLKVLKAMADVTPVAVLARRSALNRMLAAMSTRDVWAPAVPGELQPAPDDA
jgi:hypothetical protein